jgi:5'-methylthioadenosine phosphorylase
MPHPVHIRAKREDIAPLVVAAGDPARTEQLASMLKDARTVNTNRGFLTYTGYYNGRRVTASTHGIGGPSSAIVFEELHMLGAKSIVRLGTCGGLVKELSRGDFIVPTGAAHPGGFLRAYVPDGVLPPIPDTDLTAKLTEACRSEGVRFRSGVVFSSDAFHKEDPLHLETWMSRGAIGVEMECATLFTLAALRGFRAAALLVLSDSYMKKAQNEMLAAEDLRAQIQRGAKIVLDTLTQSSR